jgi:hypothetical protein
MAIINLDLQGHAHGERTARLAEAAALCKAAYADGRLTGQDLLIYKHLCDQTCWDAALFCAWAAKGIESTRINIVDNTYGIASARDPAPIFGPNPTNTDAIRVHTAQDLLDARRVPRGAFIGFLNRAPQIAHAPRAAPAAAAPMMVGRGFHVEPAQVIDVGPPVFRHCMINLGDGFGAGCKNDCIYPQTGSSVWERLYLVPFFSDPHAADTVMVFAPVVGQQI